jgi:osmoprotectant transport system substrate-binding protein
MREAFVVRGAFVLASATALLAACSTPRPGPVPPRDDAIVVGSFNFAESRLLGEVYAQALERAGFSVRRELDLGTRELVEPALERGLIELVPEYGGSLATFLSGDDGSAAGSTSLDGLLAERGLVALDAAPAQDRNAVVVTADVAARFHLRTVSDLASVDDRIALGGPPECPDRPLCLPGLASVYGLSFARFVPLDRGGPVTLAALLRGQVQAALMFTSDGAIRANDLVVLRDDRRLQPPEHVTPVVRADVLDRFGPRLARTVNAVSARLTTEVLRTLNELVAVQGRSAAVVAAEWLAAHVPVDDLR